MQSGKCLTITWRRVLTPSLRQKIDPLSILLTISPRFIHFLTLKMDAKRSSDTMVNIYQTHLASNRFR